MNKYLAETILTSTGWLSEQPKDFQSKLLQCATLMTIEPNTFVYHFDDDPGGIFGIADGSIAALLPTMGGSYRLATMLRSGVWFGSGPLLRGGRRSLSFRAADQSTLVRVELTAINAWSSNEPEIMRNFATLSERGAEITAQVVHDLLIPDTDKRIAATLLRMFCSDRKGANGRTRSVRLNQSELAEMANTSRHSANRTLRVLEQAGWVAVSYRSIELLDYDSLAAFAHAAD